MIRHWPLELAYSTFTIAALAFVASPAWAQHGGGGGHEGGGGGHGSGGGHGGGGGAQFSGSRGFATSPGSKGWSGGNFNRGGYNNWGGNGYRGYGYYGGIFGGFPSYWGWGGLYPYGGYGSYPYNSDYAPDYGYSAPSSNYSARDTVYAPPADTSTPPAPQSTIPDDAVLIGVRVPENAEIWIDGDKTSQTGTFREFVTPALELGHRFSYNIKARWTENGKKVLRDRKLSFYAGDRLMVNLMAPPQKLSTQVPSGPKP